jgi:hypothetical protein
LPHPWNGCKNKVINKKNRTNDGMKEAVNKESRQ